MLLEALIIPLKLDKSGLEAGVNSAMKTVKGVAVATAAGVVAVTAAINHAVQATIKWGDEMDALQDVTDLTNDQVAGLNILLRKHGVEAGTAAKSLTILNKGLVDSKGNLSNTGKALKDWGIDAKDVNGTLKDTATLT
jgi:hypothetical protein